MDAIKNLPLPVRIGIPAVVVLVAALVAWMVVLKAPPMVPVISTQDVGVYNTAQTVLDSQSIRYVKSQDNGTFYLKVPADQAEEAAAALARSGIQDRTGLAKKIKCPAAPGFTATKAANERANNCADAEKVQVMLMTAGAIAANVQVSQEANGTLLGPENSKNVVAQVFLPEHMKNKWKAEQAAQAIAGSVGTSIDRVSITDDQLQTLFDGASSASADSPGEGSLSSLGCEDIAGATEIETKKAAVRACYSSEIGDKLTELLGGSDYYVLTVEPTIQSAAVTTTSVTNTKGPVSDRSTQSGSGSNVEDVSSPPNTSETTRINPAGAISSLRISVTIDKNAVGGSASSDQVLAVKRLLSTYIEPKRGDPAPTVTVTTFAAGAGDKATNDDLKAIEKAASDTQSEPLVPGGTRPETQMPTWAIAMMAALVIGMVTAIVLLWRRSSSMAAERARLEQEFQQDQRLFENFAQQNPDQLARDLNALFGAPSSTEQPAR